MLAIALSAGFLALATVPPAAAPAPSSSAAAASYFLVRLIPPRPTFAASMTSEERAVMDKHVAYWMAQVKTGNILIFGPIQDPAGIYGLMILRASSEAEARELTSNDPAIIGHIGMRSEIYPFIKSVVGTGN